MKLYYKNNLKIEATIYSVVRAGEIIFAIWGVFSKVYCHECQSTVFDAFFQEVKGREWYRGSYLWEYKINEDNGPDANQRYNFSPRQKASEKIIRKHYQQSPKKKSARLKALFKQPNQ